jgi:ankyrin repeat protein
MKMRDSQGKTPLHYAAEAGDNSTVVRLIQLGAEINAVDHSGRTAAAYAEDNNHFQVLDQLTALGGRRERTELTQPLNANPSYLADLSIGTQSPQFKDFLGNVDRTFFSLQKTSEMLAGRSIEKLQ